MWTSLLVIVAAVGVEPVPTVVRSQLALDRSSLVGSRQTLSNMPSGPIGGDEPFRMATRPRGLSHWSAADGGLTGGASQPLGRGFRCIVASGGGAGASPFPFALAPFGCVRLLHEVQEVPRVLGKQGSHLARGNVEELPPWVDQVDPHGRQRLVEASLQPDGVVAEHQRMDVVAEGHRRIAELIDSVLRVEPSSQADLDHALAEGAAVADDIHIAGADVGRPGLDPLEGLLDLGDFGLELVSAG